MPPKLKEIEQRKVNPNTLDPRVSATDLVNPPPPVKFTEPTLPSINKNSLKVARNVAKNINGIIEADTAESQRLKELRQEQAGFGIDTQALFQKSLEDNGVNVNLKELKDINLQLADMQTGSDLTKTRIAGAGGQTLTQGQREVTQEERENAVRQTGLAARAAVLTDNISTATALARDAVNFAFQDAQLDMQNRTAQINDLRDVVDGQTQQLLDAELREIEKEEARIKEVKTAINSAILAGADQATISAMLSPDTPDDEKLRLAQTAIGASARTDIALERAAKNASIRASNANAAVNEAELAVVRAKQAQIQEAVASGQVILDKDQQDAAMKLGKQFEDESKNFKVQVDAYNRITASATDPSAAGDLSLIFGYMKMLDPTSVVRETEFANAENAAGIPERIRAQYNKALRGERLTESTRADFVDRAGKIYTSALDQQVDLEDTYRQQGTSVYGLPVQAVDLVVRDIRSKGAVSEVVFGQTLNALSDEQLKELINEGYVTSTPMQ